MIQPQKKQNNQAYSTQWKDDQKRGKWKRDKLNAPSIFITKTFEILQNESHSDIVSWNQEGTNFTIIDVQRFEQEILPIYFRHRNFSSFVRQLNMYDFHKIRNQLNKNIFEHKDFRRNAVHLLRNIKRKGCTNTKKSLELADDPSYQNESLEENYLHYEDKQDQSRPTLAAIQNKTQIQICKPQENLFKQQLMEDFIASLPYIDSELEVKEIIKNMKKDSKYNCLSSKEDVKKVVRKIRRNKMKKDSQDGLEQLSIEEEIMVENVDDRQRRPPTLAILSSDNYLPRKTQNLICSLILFDDATYKN